MKVLRFKDEPFYLRLLLLMTDEMFAKEVFYMKRKRMMECRGYGCDSREYILLFSGKRDIPRFSMKKKVKMLCIILPDYTILPKLQIFSISSHNSLTFARQKSSPVFFRSPSLPNN